MRFGFSITSVFFLFLFACGPKQLAEYSSYNQSLDSSVNGTGLDSIINPYRLNLEKQMSEIIGYSDSTLLNFAPESPLSNFVADVVYNAGYEFAVKNQIGSTRNTIFSLLNFGGIRAPINKGEITKGNLYELMPFDNTIVIVQVSPEKIKQILNYLHQNNGQPVGNAGFRLSLDNKEMIIGEELYNFDQDIFIVSSDYLVNGGDKMGFFKDPIKRWNTDILIRDAFISYVTRAKNILYTPVEGRMQIQY